MKYFLLLLAVLISRAAYSVPPLDLSGFNEKGEFITVIGESEGEMHSEILIENNGKRVHLKNQDCKYSDSHEIFSCSKDSESPLAGTSYQVKSPASARWLDTIDCGVILSCVSGCDSSAPIELVESGYECYEEVTCPNVGNDNGKNYLKSRKGVINSDSVNVRLNSHSQSKILGTLDKGVRVNVIGTDYFCTMINSKIGMWVSVSIESDAKQIEYGWVYDYYITYLE